MARIRFVCVCAGIVSVLLGAGLAVGDSPVASLNGTVSFTSDSAPSDTLFVDSGQQTVEATSAAMIQGAANSRISVVSTPGSGVVLVANVTLRSGDSLYQVNGIYLGSGNGTPVGWVADYNKGVPRVVLSISGPAVDPGDVALGDNGGTLTVTIAGGSSGTYYTVTLSQSGNGSPAGAVGFSTTSVTVAGSGSQTVSLSGLTIGFLTITGTCPNATTGSVNTTVEGYLPGPAPTWDIAHQTEEQIPVPTDRTDIGGGELVDCWIENWQDTDLWVHSGQISQVSDTMGDVLWVASGAGTVDPEFGPSTVLTADCLGAADTVVVAVTVNDSGTKGIDAPIVQTVAFNVPVPTGTKTFFNSDMPNPNWRQGNNRMAACSTFWNQVLPDTVSFRQRTFRENIAKQSFTWPNGAKISEPAFKKEFRVGIGVAAVVANLPNITISVDSVGGGLEPIQRLNTGSGFVSYELDKLVPLEYLVPGDNPVQFDQPTHPRSYSGTNFQTTVGIVCSNTQWGGAQGPWQ